MNIPLGPVFSHIDAFLLIFVRMTGLFVVAPIFGRKNVPAYLKIGLSFLITLILVNTIKIPDLTGYETVLQFGLLVAKEFFVGITIGFVSFLAFSAIYLAGQIIDMQIGFGMINVLDPLSNIQVPITANFYFIVGMLVFLGINGHQFLIKALFDSFEIIPLGTAVFTSNLINDFIVALSNMFVLGFKISAPVIAAIMITDVALGVISRTVPQLNVFVVGMPVKIAVGLVLMLITVPMLIGAIGVLVSNMKIDMYNFLRNMVNTR